jgi:hypothetical protein
LSLEDAKEFVDEANKTQDRWVGAEPLSTQYTVEETFTRTRFNKELSGAYKHHYASRNQYMARLRVLPQQVGKAQTKDIAATGRIPRDHVYNQLPIELCRLNLGKSCTKCGREHEGNCAIGTAILSGCSH